MKVGSIDSVQDYWQVALSLACISAYGKLTLSSPVVELVGEVVKAVDFQEQNNFEVRLSNGGWFRIALEPEQNVGPEAFSVHFSSGQIVVE